MRRGHGPVVREPLRELPRRLQLRPVRRRHLFLTLDGGLRRLRSRMERTPPLLRRHLSQRRENFAPPTTLKTMSTEARAPKSASHGPVDQRSGAVTMGEFEASKKAFVDNLADFGDFEQDFLDWTRRWQERAEEAQRNRSAISNVEHNYEMLSRRFPFQSLAVIQKCIDLRRIIVSTTTIPPPPEHLKAANALQNLHKKWMRSWPTHEDARAIEETHAALRSTGC